jgi:hypothetical protein
MKIYIVVGHSDYTEQTDNITVRNALGLAKICVEELVRQGKYEDMHIEEFDSRGGKMIKWYEYNPRARKYKWKEHEG